MAFNASDIAAGLRLAIQLHDYGFNQENSVDIRYRNFRNDIFNFRHLLEKLEQSLQNAQRRYERSPHPTAIHAHSPLSTDFEDERKTIVGNFVETLSACDRLLEENKKYRMRYSNVVENLKWHLSQQERRIDDLRTRLQFHSEKIRLVMDRLSINLLTDTDAKVDDILAMSEQNVQISNEILHELVGFRSALFGHFSRHHISLSREAETSHRVSDIISLKFQEYLLIDAPQSISRGMPLTQGFDALFSSFQQSISSVDCTPESYLSFLKTRWLLERLLAGAEYRAARPGFYYKRAINQISQALKVRMQQPGVLISYEENMLISLPDTHFRVWPPSDPAPTTLQSGPYPLMVRADEEEIMHMKLDSDDVRGSDTVTIFKSSEEHFRIIQEIRVASKPDEKILIPQPISTREDKMIPRYALPMIDEPGFEVAIVSRNEETLYRFGTSETLFRFQSALIGYEVTHDQGAIRCQFSDDVSHLDCKGRVQLWQEPIVLGSPNEARRSSNAPSSFSDGKTHSRYDSLAATAVTANTIRWTTGGWEDEGIKLPAIVIFTELTDTRDIKQFAILFLELETGVNVDPKECSCCRAYDTCSKLVLTNGKKGMTVRALFSDVEHTGHSGFDLFPFRTPRHPEFRKLKTLRTEYLVLKFGRLEDKRRFDKELDYRFRVRDKQTQNQQDFDKRMQKLETLRSLRQPDLSPIRPHGRAPSEASSSLSMLPRAELSRSRPRLDSSFVGDINPDKGLKASPAVYSTKRMEILKTRRPPKRGLFADFKLQPEDSNSKRTADIGRTILEENIPRKPFTPAIAISKAQEADLVLDDEVDSNTQARPVSRRGHEDYRFQDSRLGSSTQQESGRNLDASCTDTSSISDTPSTSRLEESLRIGLKDHFVNRLVTETEICTENDDALEEVSKLLRDFGILLRRNARQQVHYEVATFIRNERLSLAEAYSKEASSRLRTRHEVNGQAMVSEWLVAKETPASSYDNLDTELVKEQPNDLVDASDASGESLLADWLVEDITKLKMIEEHRKFLLGSSQFRWLVSRINVMNMRSCLGSSYHTIRGVIAKSLDRTDRDSTLTITLRGWDPVRFLEQQYSCEPRELSRVLVYCGSLERPYACTIGEYLNYMWPNVGGVMLTCIQSACSSQKESRAANVGGATLFVKIQYEGTRVSLSGHGQSILELAEACVWLATACRAHDGSDDPAICSPLLDAKSLDMTVSYTPVAEEHALVEGMCWLGMLRNPNQCDMTETA